MAQRAEGSAVRTAGFKGLVGARLSRWGRCTSAPRRSSLASSLLGQAGPLRATSNPLSKVPRLLSARRLLASRRHSRMLSLVAARKCSAPPLTSTAPCHCNDLLLHAPPCHASHGTYIVLSSCCRDLPFRLSLPPQSHYFVHTSPPCELLHPSPHVGSKSRIGKGSCHLTAPWPILAFFSSLNTHACCS